jgi:hypothetical protein
MNLATRNCVGLEVMNISLIKDTGTVPKSNAQSNNNNLFKKTTIAHHHRHCPCPRPSPQ